MPRVRALKNREVMTVREVAAYLRLSPLTVYHWVNAGKIPGFRLGGGWRFHRRELEQWIRRSRKSRESSG